MSLARDAGSPTKSSSAKGMAVTLPPIDGMDGEDCCSPVIIGEVVMPLEGGA